MRQVRAQLMDLQDGTSRPITGRGDFRAAALDASGRILVTAHADGSVRVGPVTGGEPHLLLGHGGPVAGVAVSPDGQWIASSSGTEIRLWPMPDVSKPPFHTLPYAVLMAKLDAPDEPACRRGRRLGHRLQARHRPLPRLEGRANLVRQDHFDVENPKVTP